MRVPVVVVMVVAVVVAAEVAAAAVVVAEVVAATTNRPPTGEPQGDEGGAEQRDPFLNLPGDMLGLLHGAVNSFGLFPPVYPYPPPPPYALKPAVAGSGNPMMTFLEMLLDEKTAN